MSLLKEGKTNWKYILIIVILATIISGGILGWWYRGLSKEGTEELEMELPEKVEEKTADWKIYKNEKWGFEIRYPDHFQYEPFTIGPLSPLLPEDGGFLIDEEGSSSIAFGPLVIEEKVKPNVDKNVILEEASLFNPCYEDEAFEPQIEETANFIMIKVNYFVRKGCQGSRERFLDKDVNVFFLKPDNTVTIHFYNGDIHREAFNQIVSTFRFLE